MPLLIELVKPEDLAVLQLLFPSVDFVGKVQLAGQPRSRQPLYFTDEPSDSEKRFNFYDALMRERPERGRKALTVANAKEPATGREFNSRRLHQ